MSYPSYELTFSEVMHDGFENSKAHGFAGTSTETHIAMMHSELSEAFEEHRAGNDTFYIKDGKPEGLLTELADAVIRVCVYCQEHGLDLPGAIRTKMAYNRTRPFKHGGKKY